MSLILSNLGTSVNFAVATTLEAINATMFEYLSNDSLPVVNYCWIQNAPADPLTAISLQDLMSSPVTAGGTNGTNPFNVPNWTTTDPVPTDITNMQNSNFICGIQMQLGLPPGMAMPGAPNPNNYPVLPYVLSLNSSSTNTAIFNLLCVQFQVVFQAWGNHGVFTFNNETQSSGSAWVITLNVPLSSVTAASNSGIPQNVINQLNSLGQDLFSIQQLFLDFASAVFTTVPSFTDNFPAIVTNQITPAMIQTFITENDENNGLSVLGYSITQNSPDPDPSSLNVGSLTLVFDEYNPSGSDTINLSTLNYLCNQGSTPPPQNYSGINWNWIDSGGDGPQYDGAVAISSDVFTPYFASLLINYVAANCYLPVMSAYYSHLAELNVSYSFTKAGVSVPAYTTGTEGNIINFSYQSQLVEASCGDHVLLTYFDFQSSVSYTLSVTVAGNLLTIVQHLVIYAYVEWESSLTTWSGNYIDTTYTDVYQMNVAQNGNLVFDAPVQTVEKNGAVPPSNSVANFMLGINAIANYINDNVQFAATNLQGIPAASIGTFVFPGGQTFTYAAPQFSESNDLVAYITYTV